MQALNEDQATGDEGGVSLFDMLIFLVQEKRWLIGISLAGVLLSLAVALLLPRYFVARAVLLPPQQQGGAGVAMAQLGALAGMAANVTSMKSVDEMYVAFMRTRRLQDAVIQKLGLVERYAASGLDATRVELSGRVDITADKKAGMITIEAMDADAAFAAKLANAHVEELRRLLDELAVTDAQQRRLFFEQQVGKAQRALVAAEQAFRVAQTQGGLVVSDALAESGVKEAARVRAEIAAREIELDAMSRFATPANPEVVRLQAALAALRQQQARLEGGTPGAEPKLGGQAAVQAYRDIKVQEALLEILIKQFEMAKVDESKEGPLLQVIDQAVSPERATRPKRLTIVLMGSMAAVFLGCIVAVTRGAIRRAGRHPASAWQRLKLAWR